jgi:hypothetical protein
LEPVLALVALSFVFGLYILGFRAITELYNRHGNVVRRATNSVFSILMAPFRAAAPILAVGGLILFLYVVIGIVSRLWANPAEAWGRMENGLVGGSIALILGLGSACVKWLFTSHRRNLELLKDPSEVDRSRGDESL